ncbi:hypothetical protein D9M70_469820 [compost metagenome]
MQALAKHPATADLLLWWSCIFQLKAWNAAQFASCLLDDHIEFFPQRPSICLSQIPGCLDAHPIKVLGHAPADTPDVTDFAGLEQSVSSFRITDVQHPTSLTLPFLGAVIGELCKGLRGANTHTHRDASATQHAGSHFAAETNQIARNTGEIGKALIDAVHLG